MQRFKKLKDHVFLKRKKEFLLYIGVLIAVLGTISITSAIINHGRMETTAAAQTLLPNSYRVFIEGKDMGLVATREDGEIAIKQAIDGLINELGYDPEVTPQIRYYEEYTSDEELIALEGLVPQMQQVIKEGIEVIKVKAYAMKIGEDFVVALGSEEAVKQVLQNAQDVYVSEDSQFAVMLEANPYNGLITSPNIVSVKDALDEDRNFATAALVQVANASNTSEAVGAATLATTNQRKTIGVEFTEEIMVVETFVDAEKVLSIEEATQLITKENQEPGKYIVQSGDCSSTIAVDNKMPIETLFALNTNINEDTVLQIGDELIVMVPEPELSIKTLEEVIYPAPVSRETTYVENNSKYVGSNSVLNEGSDGVKQLTATVTNVNGQEIDRDITKEEIVTEPVNKVIEKGTKPVPVNSPKGSFIYPVVNYTLSSRYGSRWGGTHFGIDLAAPIGTGIRASEAGVVTFSGWSSGFGWNVIINHGNNTTTRYAHCSKLLVSVGQTVAQYEDIAKVGNTGDSTGPHCHFEIRYRGAAVNPLNYLNK